MTDWPILSVVTFLPAVGAVFILLVRGDERTVARNARASALWTSLIAFALSILLWTDFDNSTADFQYVERVAWIPSLGIDYHMGVDGISMLFVLLATFLTPLCVLCSWDAIRTRVKEYMIAFLLLETLMVGMFSALDLVLFYVFFEGVLIPMFLIIGVWGGGNRVYAATQNGYLYAFDAATGQSHWQLNLNAPVNQPMAYAAGILYIRTSDGVLHAVK